MGSRMVSTALISLLFLLAGHRSFLHAETSQSQKHGLNVEVVAESLQNPWGMIFLPNRDILVTKCPGRLRHIQGGNLLPAPIDGLPAIKSKGKGGLLGIALPPDLANNRRVYLAYVAGS